MKMFRFYRMWRVFGHEFAWWTGSNCRNWLQAASKCLHWSSRQQGISVTTYRSAGSRLPSWGVALPG